jgi:DNA repair protein RadD
VRYQLRDYQLRAVEQVRARLRAGESRVLLVAPTGSGKTLLAASMIEGAAKLGRRVWFLAHRVELVAQASEKLDGFGVPHGVMMRAFRDASGSSRERPGEPVQVASVPTVARRAHVGPSPDVVFVDEAHRSLAASYAGILEAHPGATVIGLTATPWRSDGRGLGDLYQSLVVVADVRDLVRRGFLCDYTGFLYDDPDLGGVKVRRGDYDERQLGEVMGGASILGRMVERWREHADGLATVVFAVSVEHSKRIVADFIAAGVAAEHLDGETPADLRRGILARLADGRTQVVSNVGVLVEGVDVPCIACVILACPTLSLSRYLQMVGRGMRPHPGKARLRIHDHAGCIARHGLPDLPRDWSLESDVSVTREAKRRTDSGEVLVCRGCGATCEKGVPACPECGKSFQRQARKVVEVAGLKPIDLDDVRRTRGERETDREEFRALVAEQEQRGEEPGWAARVWRMRHGGEAPRWSWLRESLASARRKC